MVVVAVLVVGGVVAGSEAGDVLKDAGALLEALDRADKVAVDSILAHADLRHVVLVLGSAALGLAREVRDGGRNGPEVRGLTGVEFAPDWPGGVFDFEAWLRGLREVGAMWDLRGL